MAKQSNFQKFVRKAYRFINTVIERLRKADKRFLMMVGIAIVIVIILVVLICVGVGSQKNGEESSSNPPADSYVVEEPSTDDEAAAGMVAQLNGTGTYVVSTGSAAALNMRPTAGTEYDVIVTIPNGTKVDVLFIDDSSAADGSKGWGYIEYNGARGWVSMDYLTAE